MAAAETFTLDFKFGGNTEFLTKLETLMERIDKNFTVLNEEINETQQQTEELKESVDDMADSFEKLDGVLDNVAKNLGYVVKGYLGLQGLEKIWNFGMQSMDVASIQERGETQLRLVMRNMGTEDQFQNIKDRASRIQEGSIYGDEALIGGAGELATYVKGAEALGDMMELLADYAAGMTGGGEVDYNSMIGYATGLGMAYDGNYMAMRRKGFDTSRLELLDALGESGGRVDAGIMKKFGADVAKENAELIANIQKAGGVTEAMRVDALKESLSTWKGLNEEIAKMDSSAPIRLKNKIGDLQEALGQRLYPTFNKLVDAIDKHLPDIESMMGSIGDMFETMVEAVEKNLDTFIALGKALSKALSLVAEFPRGTVAAVAAFKAIQGGAFNASRSVVQMNEALTVSSMKLALFNKNAVLAAGAGAVSGVTADVGSDKSSGENAMGALGAMAQGAALGASQFGLLGAAIGAATSSLGTFIKGLVELFKVSSEQKELKARMEEQYSYHPKWAEMLRKMKNGDAGSAVNLHRSLREYEEKYGISVAGTFYAKDSNYQSIFAQEAAAAKSNVTNLYNSGNTNITQNVELTADIDKVGLLLNANMRAIIESQVRLNRESSIVTEI